MKKLGQGQRWLILGPLLIASVAAAWLIEDDGEEPVQPRPRGERRLATEAAVPTPVAQADAARTADRREGEGEPGKKAEALGIDPFRAKSWYVAPPPPPPPKPTAPPLPFKYVGQLVEEGETRVFITSQNRQLVIKVGDTVDGSYAVEEISPGQVVFVYLPLKERQVLATGRV